MSFELRSDCAGVDWARVSEILKTVGMASHAPDIHQKAFEASHTVVFIYHENSLIGFGRAISDGAYQAAVYDVAIVPEFQKKGIGTMILKKIMDNVPTCHIILYAFPGRERFYQSLGFNRMKTGMAFFLNDGVMRERGFIE